MVGLTHGNRHPSPGRYTTRAGLEQGRSLFPDSRPQVARRTSGAAHDQPRAALPEVRDLLGHASIEMTERYAHLAPERLRGAVARLEGA